jgi:hypothetical protein
MAPDIAERWGKAPAERSSPRPCPPESGIFALSEYLAGNDAKTLEQEELDPRLPDVNFDGSSVRL